MAVDDLDFGLLQKLRKLPHVLESIDVFAVSVLLSVDLRFTLAALPLLSGRTVIREPAGALATQVAELSIVVKVPVLSDFRMPGPSGNCSTDPVVEELELPAGIVQPASSSASSASFSLDTATLSLLGFFLAFLLSEPYLLPGALVLPAIVKFGGDCDR